MYKINKDIENFISFRKILHQNPELSGAELETKERIRNFIARFNPDEILEVGKTGLIFRFDGKENGQSILIRAELDALPIQEINDFEYKSNKPGISHKCGHDGHMTILARLAWLLSKNPPNKGKVYLLFQPAEENGMGAKEVYQDIEFQKLSIDAVVALHNLPGFPLHQICIKEAAFTPAVTSVIIKYTGKTSHAAEPELGLNPAAAMAELIQKSLALSIPHVEKDNFYLVTPVYMNMGEQSYGVSAGYGEVHLTVRAWDNQLLQEQTEQLEQSAKNIAAQHQLQIELQRTQEFQANLNDKQMVGLIEQASKSLNLDIYNLKNPMKWGEDFGLFTEHYKGCMFGLGAGVELPALHNPDYDFPDELIETGSNIFEEIIKLFLNEK